MTKASLRFGSTALGVTLLLGACGSATTLVVRPTTPVAAELVPTPQLAAHAYRRLLLLPPEGGVNVAADVDVTIARDRGVAHYMNKLEKLLLSQGFEVISQEIVARLGQGKGPSESVAARALMMGKETHADAVLMIQSISVVNESKFYHIEDLTEVEPGLRVEDDGEYTHKTTGACLYRLPYYELRLDAKLVDVQSGDVLWVGAARETILDAFKESWTAKLDDECRVEEQAPFIYRDEMQAEETFDRTLAALYDRMFMPMKKAALSGKPIVREEPPKVEPPKPEPVKVVEAPKPPEPPKVKMAVVSSNQAILREGPGKKETRVRNVPRKAKVEVVETMGEWIKVKVQDGTVGWMHESMLILPD